MGIVWVFSDTGAKPILLKQYRRLNRLTTLKKGFFYCQIAANGKITSPVWNFFKVFDKDIKFAICNVCGSEIPRGGSQQSHFNTTNMIRHIRTRHRTQYAEYEKMNKPKLTSLSSPSLSQPTVSDAFKVREPYSRDSKKWKEITQKILELICLDEQPLSVKEDTGFRRLLPCLDPRYDPSGRKYLTDVCLPALYQTVYTHIDKLMKDSVHISFTSDTWSADVVATRW